MKPKIIRTGNRDGGEVVRVELANKPGVFVILDAADYDEWAVSGRPCRFLLNKNGPLTGTYRVIYSDRSVAGGIAGVAREIVRPGPGRLVHFRDGDRLILRRANLEVRGGRAKGQTPAPSLYVDEFGSSQSPEAELDRLRALGQATVASSAGRAANRPCHTD